MKANLVELQYIGDYSRTIPGLGTYEPGAVYSLDHERAAIAKSTGLFLEVEPISEVTMEKKPEKESRNGG